MHRLNPTGCWGRPPSTPPQHPGSLTSATLSHRRGEEEGGEEGGEDEEHPAVCCHTTGCEDGSPRAAGAQWSPQNPPISSGIPSGVPGAPSPRQPGSGGGAWQHFPAGGWSVCVCGQRNPQGLGLCWSGSPYTYYGVRRNLVVGVEVVEEVAVEDTLEVITEDIYSDDLLDPELLQDTRLYPT